MNQRDGRLVYTNALNTLGRAGVSANVALLTQSYLRFEINLSTAQTRYQFDTLVNENLNTNFVTQQKLNLQDAFICSSIGFYIGLAASSAATETVVPLYTYADPTIFSTANAATSLQTVYGGQMSLTVNQRQVVPSWDLYKHYYVPVTQTGNNPTGVTAATLRNSVDFSQNGYYTVEPNIIINGAKKNELVVNLSQALTAIQANSRIVCIMQGILAQNVTNVR
jgi:hypothetical protein